MESMAGEEKKKVRTRKKMSFIHEVTHIHTPFLPFNHIDTSRLPHTQPHLPYPQRADGGS